MNKVLKSFKFAHSDTEYFNGLTIEMDKYIDYQMYPINTYLYEPYNEMKNNRKEDGSVVIAIRYPGATRGHIVIDKNNIIIDIVIYNDYKGGKDLGDKTCSGYSIEVREAVKRFIGYKIELCSEIEGQGKRFKPKEEVLEFYPELQKIYDDWKIMDEDRTKKLKEEREKESNKMIIENFLKPTVEVKNRYIKKMTYCNIAKKKVEKTYDRLRKLFVD